MTSDLVPWLVAGGLAVVVVVLVVLLRRHQTSTRAELDAADRARRDELAQREAEHRDETARIEADRAAQVEAAEARRRDAVSEAEESRALLRRGMKWEEASEQAILRACRAAGVNGVLMTNVVFVPVGETEQGSWRTFVAQVDHVLVSDSGRGLVIESKRWGGIVFDGRRPSEVHPAFRNLVDESSLVPPFAVQVQSRKVLNAEEEAENWWRVRVQAKSASPAQQVRQQARRLARFVDDRTGVSRTWFDTCVFYSSPSAAAFVQAEDRSGTVTTSIVTNDHELQSALAAWAAKDPVPNRTRADAVVRALAGQGAHAITVGNYRLPE
ncbi:nuclease-related domain-containing protein [Curtobacterium sp. MCBD17_032]|uniref:nuclease-related domain-containing protein n=1 Tax=Curtobacterium sp. MCBD17_032 TaxID=2175659 RepID=UPI000DA8FAA5|nr:nuclease-related domain-containing protein [Curtobacterium sp. MCBD17_032]PZE86255.1 hypothetical protein DEI91_03890 [Curtobacterium sp. MCBD17_032]